MLLLRSLTILAKNVLFVFFFLFFTLCILQFSKSSSVPLVYKYQSAPTPQHTHNLIQFIAMATGIHIAGSYRSPTLLFDIVKNRVSCMMWYEKLVLYRTLAVQGLLNLPSLHLL